jgi:hypothetical protein
MYVMITYCVMFLQCEKCYLGSGKLKGHRGPHKCKREDKPTMVSKTYYVMIIYINMYVMTNYYNIIHYNMFLLMICVLIVCKMLSGIGKIKRSLWTSLFITTTKNKLEKKCL